MAIDVGRNLRKNWKPVLAALVAALAAGALALYLWTTREYPAHYVEGTGTVLVVTERSDNDDEVIYVAEIRFSDSDHVEHVFSGRVERETRPGNLIDFKYDPRDPAGTADTPLDRTDSWIVWIGALGFGMFFLVIFIFGKLTDDPKRSAD